MIRYLLVTLVIVLSQHCLLGELFIEGEEAHRAHVISDAQTLAETENTTPPEDTSHNHAHGEIHRIFALKAETVIAPDSILLCFAPLLSIFTIGIVYPRILHMPVLSFDSKRVTSRGTRTMTYSLLSASQAPPL